VGQWKKVIVESSSAHFDQVTAEGGFSGSNLNPLLAFDGNRTISNNSLPEGVYDVNYGTTGDISDFVEAVFFKNAVPTIGDNQTFSISEFTQGGVGGTFINNIDGGDTDITQTPTYAIDVKGFDDLLSDSTDNYFTITNNDGIGQLNLAEGITAETDFNIDENAPNGNAYPLPVKITDNFGSTASTVIYIKVIENRKPIFQYYNGSSFIDASNNLSHTAGTTLNENNPSGIINNDFLTLKFRDPEGDTVTITTTRLGNDPTDDDFFDFNINYTTGVIKLNQLTDNLDFDILANRSFSYRFTATDEYGAFSRFTLNWSISNNPPPTISNESFEINENSSDNDQVGVIYPNDVDDLDNSVYLFTNFTLQSVQLDNGADIKDSSTVSSTIDGPFTPTRDPFTITTSGNSIGAITRKPGVFLVASIANKYTYQATVTDIYNENFDSDTATITINISNIPAPTVSNNGTAYIVESGLNNNYITKNSNGIAGTAFVYSTDPVTQFNWEVTTTPANILKINCTSNIPAGKTSTDGTGSNVRFQLDRNLSASGENLTFQNSDKIAVTLIGSQTDFNSSRVTKNFNINLAKNNAPALSPIGDTATEITNRTGYIAAKNTQLDSVLVTADSAGDAINFDSILLTGDTNKLTSSFNSATNKIFINAKTSLLTSTGTTLNYGVKIKDIHGFRYSNQINGAIDIASPQAPTFNVNYDLSFPALDSNGGWIYESNNSSSGIFPNVLITDNYDTFPGTTFINNFIIDDGQNGFEDIFEIVPVSSYTSTNNNFNLKTKASLSGSLINHTTFPTKTLTTTISNNLGETLNGPNIIIKIRKNEAPTIGGRVNWINLNTNEAKNNALLSYHNITDTEGNYPISIHSSIGSGLSFHYVPSSNTVQIKAASNLSAGRKNYSFTVRDKHGFHLSTMDNFVNIGQAGTGTFGGGNQFYIVDTAVNGDPIHTATGYTNGNFNGTQGNINVSYVSDQGSPILTSLISSNNQINISLAGLLTIGTNINGAGAPNAGDNITTTLTATDNYGNVGTKTITVTVFANDPPNMVTYSPISANLSATSTTNIHLATFTINDDEHDYPYSATLSGTDASKLSLHSQNGNNTEYYIKNSTSISAGTLSFNVNISDASGKSSTITKTLIITAPPAHVFIYTMSEDNTEWATSSTNASTNISGIISEFKTGGKMGVSSFTTNDGFGGTTSVQKKQSGILTDLKSTSTSTGLRSLGTISNNGSLRRSIIVFPNASSLSNKPALGGIVSTRQGSAGGKYRFYTRETNDNESDQIMFIQYINLATPAYGYSSWGIIYHNSFNSLNHYWYMVDDNDFNLDV
tara:strand:- start:5098 stop:9063 length:3966 start_codon:yes stop_codon:yes gene_type:complete